MVSLLGTATRSPPALVGATVELVLDPSTWAEPSIARTSLSSWNWRWRSSRAEDLKRGREFGAWRQNLRVSPYQWPSLPQG